MKRIGKLLGLTIWLILMLLTATRFDYRWSVLGQELDENLGVVAEVTPTIASLIIEEAESSANMRPSFKLDKKDKTLVYRDSLPEFKLLDGVRFTPTVRVITAKGEEVLVKITKKQDGSDLIYSLKGDNLPPGKYLLELTDELGGEILEEFWWGVLALNTNKTVYHPLENGYISLAVLDEKGDMVCDANLALEIERPDGKIDELSTDNGKIIVNPECYIHNYTEKPDYEAEYAFGEIKGTYKFRLTAETDNGSYRIEDKIEVADDIPIEIDRIMATRIFPPKVYTAQINLKANQDFVGVVSEKVPADFKISRSDRENIKNYDRVVVEGDWKIIKWDLSLDKDEEITIGYSYDIPDISPELYLVGPMKLTDAGGTVTFFEEARLWQLAADEIAMAKIRQEINIIDTQMATTNESNSIVYIDPANYGVGASFYFEAVYDEIVTTALYSIILERVDDDSEMARIITILTPSVYNYRSRVGITGLTAGEYNIQTSSVLAVVSSARIIVIQNADEITATETQIEIGNYEIGITGATTMPLTSPKYWKYDSSVWDAGTTFFAEVSYGKQENVIVGNGLTSFTAGGNFNYIVPALLNGGIIKIEAWGAGGGGASMTSNGQGGGGGGGAYANETSYTVSTGDTLVAVVGNGVASTKGESSSVYEVGIGTSIVLAAGGLGVAANSTIGASGATAASCIGDTKYAGGNGANGGTLTGGGGGGAGDDGVGGNAYLGVGGTGGMGVGTSGGRGANGIDTTGNGSAGIAPGGGGSGAKKLGAQSRTGGPGGDGRVILTSMSAVNFAVDYYLQEDDGSFANWTNKVTIGTGLTGVDQVRARSVAFVPTSGRHYRLVGKVDNDGYYMVYSAKIIAQQTNPDGIKKLEPQYLLLNTSSVSTGTTLGFTSLWDADEWGRGSYVYRHAMDSIGAAANAKLVGITTVVTDVTNSSITGANQVIGEGMTMPDSDIDLDTWIVNAGTEIDASRILVQVTINANTIDVSGKCQKYDESTVCGVGETIRYAVNGNLKATIATVDVGGSFVFSGQTVPSSGDVITVFKSGVGISERANTVTKYMTSDLTGIRLYENHLTIGHSGGTVSLTNTNLSSYDNSVAGVGTSEVFFEVDVGGSMVGDIRGQFGRSELKIISGNEYAPAGKISVNNVDVGGTLTAAANTFDISGSWSNTGRFNSETSTVQMIDGSIFLANVLSGTMISDDKFYNLSVVADDAGWSFSDPATVANNFQSSDVSEVTLPATELTVGGDFISEGSLVANNGTIILNATDVGNTFYVASVLNNVTFNGVNGSWYLGVAVEASGNFKILNGGVTVPSTTLTIGSSFVSNGGFTHNNGTLVLNTGATSVLSIGATAITLNNISVTTPGKVVKFAQQNFVGTTATYYFNGSDAGATDPNNVWSNDNYAFDGDVGTNAYTDTPGSASSNLLTATGTNSPTIGGSISQVRTRIYGSVNVGAAGWTDLAVLTEPVGGWTWQKVNDLEARIFGFTDGPGDGELHANIYHTSELLGDNYIAVLTNFLTVQIYKIEVVVSSTTMGPTFNILGNMTVQGAQGTPVYITSDVGTTQWLPKFTSEQSNFNYVNVSMGGCATGTANIYVNSANSTNGGNNDSCWIFATPGGVPGMYQTLRHGQWFSNGTRKPHSF